MTSRHRQRLPPAKELLTRYLDYLQRHRGLSVSTCNWQRKSLSDFFAYMAGINISLREMKVEDMDGFLQSAADCGKSKSHLRHRSASLRGFLRYLFSEGWLQEDLSIFVESPRIYRDASVPPHFTWEELEQLMASIRGDTPKALRDRSLVMLLCTYGLRGGEVARLTLDDIDWKHRSMRITGRKGRSAMTLPLMAEVEAALCEYLAKGRPADAPYREVLLTSYGMPFSKAGGSVTCRLQILAMRAGLKGGRGAHAVRRAVGTRLVEQGWGAGAVATILGHKSPNTVRTYLRLSIESLRNVADKCIYT
jgi:site-specific recombinase XerD